MRPGDPLQKLLCYHYLLGKHSIMMHRVLQWVTPGILWELLHCYQNHCDTEEECPINHSLYQSEVHEEGV